MRKFTIFSLFALAAAGCGGGGSKQAASQGSPASTYRVELDTTKGPVVIEVDRNLAPNGAQRFYDLVKAGYFDGARFYRVVPGFVVQWGAARDPAVTKKWDITIPDDPVKGSNTRGPLRSPRPVSPTAERRICSSTWPTTHGSTRWASPRSATSAAACRPSNTSTAATASSRIRLRSGRKVMPICERAFPRLDYIKSARIVSGS